MKIILKYDLILPLRIIITCVLEHYHLDIFEDEFNSIYYHDIIYKSTLHRIDYTNINYQWLHCPSFTLNTLSHALTFLNIIFTVEKFKCWRRGAIPWVNGRKTSANWWKYLKSLLNFFIIFKLCEVCVLWFLPCYFIYFDLKKDGEFIWVHNVRGITCTKETIV